MSIPIHACPAAAAPMWIWTAAVATTSPRRHSGG